MWRYLKALCLVIPFFILACPAPKGSNVADNIIGEEVENPIFESVTEVAGPNGSLWKGSSADGRYKLTFDMRKDGWTGVIRVEDSQATNPAEDMYKCESVFEGTSVQPGNIIVFNIKLPANGWKIDASLKVKGQGKGLGNVHIKDKGLKFTDVAMTQTKN